ncbi:hypothetical protein BH11MYX2_BH11MYX2_39110 [soil metagenome]
MIAATGAVIVLASDWRRGRDLLQLRHELDAAGVEGSLIDTTPILEGQPRWKEIEAWMIEHDVADGAVAIIDDLWDMGALAARFVRASPLYGFDEAAAGAIMALFAITPR